MWQPDDKECQHHQYCTDCARNKFLVEYYEDKLGDLHANYFIKEGSQKFDEEQKPCVEDILCEECRRTETMLTCQHCQTSMCLCWGVKCTCGTTACVNCKYIDKPIRWSVCSGCTSYTCVNCVPKNCRYCNKDKCDICGGAIPAICDCKYRHDFCANCTCSCDKK